MLAYLCPRRVPKVLLDPPVHQGPTEDLVMTETSVEKDHLETQGSKVVMDRKGSPVLLDLTERECVNECMCSEIMVVP